MEQHNSITEITLMQCARCLTPRPPVRAPGFPIAKATATVWAGGWRHGHGGWLGRFPSSVSLLENALAFSGPFGRCLGVPSFGANGGCSRVVGKKNVSVHAKLAVDLGLEFLGGGVSGLQVGHQPTLHFTRIVHIRKQKVKAPHQTAVAGFEFTFNGDGQRLEVSPQGDGHLFVVEVLRSNVVQEQDDTPALLFLGFAPFCILPIGSPRCGHEDRLFLVPSCFEKTLGLKRKPTGIPVVPARQVHVEQILNRSVNGGS